MNFDPRSVKRARWFLRIFGIAFLLIGIYLSFNREGTRDYAPEICAAIGCLVLIIGQFTSDRWVKRVEMLLTGWF